MRYRGVARGLDERCGEWPPIRCEIVVMDEPTRTPPPKTVCGFTAGPGSYPVVEEWPQPWEARAALKAQAKRGGKP